VKHPIWVWVVFGIVLGSSLDECTRVEASSPYEVRIQNFDRLVRAVEAKCR
jgi:hypothetical protein